ncbi:MAG: hypothetical protein ACRDEA_16945, partial [Microcystaceae cyanobacterium]
SMNSANANIKLKYGTQKITAEVTKSEVTKSEVTKSEVKRTLYKVRASTRDARHAGKHQKSVFLRLPNNQRL